MGLGPAGLLVLSSASLLRLSLAAESCVTGSPGLLDDAVSAVQKEAVVAKIAEADRVAEGVDVDVGSSSGAGAALDLVQDVKVRLAAAKQEQEERLIESNSLGASVAGGASTVAVGAAAVADASSGAAVQAALSAGHDQRSGVALLSKPGARYGRRQQQPLPEALDRTLEAMPRLGGTGSKASNVFSLFSAGATAAMKHVVPSFFDEEPKASASGPAATTAAAHRSPAARAAAATDRETRASPGAVQLLNKGRRVTKEKKQKAYYSVDSADTQLKNQTGGLSYRQSKNLDDKDAELKPVAWGSTVSGLDEGDGWLKVDNGYLPFAIQGSAVLALKAEPTAMDIVAATEAASTTCPFSGSLRQGLHAYLACLADRCEDWDPALQKGINCEETFLPLGCDTDMAEAFTGEPKGTMISAACPALCGRCTDPLVKHSKRQDNLQIVNRTAPKWAPGHQSASQIISGGTATTAASGEQVVKHDEVADIIPHPPSVQAWAVEFEDHDERSDYVKGPVLVKKAHDEKTLQWYSLWWAAKGKRLPKTGALKVMRKTGSDLRFDLPRSKVPEGAEGLMVVTGNTKGEMKTGPMALFSVETGPSFSEIFEGFLRGG